MRANDKRRWTGWIVVLALSGAAVAQEGPHPLLAKGRIFEESEYDLEAAAKLYIQVARDESVGRDVRSDAFLRLAKVRQKQGEVALAVSALQNAVNGAGPAAAEANGLLADAKKLLAGPQDPQRADRSVDLEILRLMTVVREQQGAGRADEALEEIAWFGARAVPLLAEAARTETDFGFVTYCAKGLMQIGGEKVDAWIDEATRYDDPLRRRAVARAVGSASEAQTRRLAAFLGDPVAEVRVEAIERGVLVDWTQATVLLRDEDERVREATLRWLGGRGSTTALRGGERPRPGQERAVVGALLDVFDEQYVGVARLGGGTVTRRVAISIQMTADPVDRAALFLRVVQSPALAGSNPGFGVNTSGPFAPNALVDEVLAAARSVQQVDPSGPERWRLDFFSSVRDAVTPSWNREVLPAVLELARLGHPCDSSWFAGNLEGGDWVRFFENLDAFVGFAGAPNALLRQPIANDYLKRPLDQALQVELPVQAFEPLRKAFEGWLAQSEDGPPTWSVLERAAIRLGMFDHEQSLSWCERMLTTGLAVAERARGEPKAVEAMRMALLQGLGSKDGPARRAMFRRVLVAEGEGLAELRNSVLGLLVFLGDEEAAPLFGKAYERGLAGSRFPRPLNVERSSWPGSGRGLGWLAKWGGSRTVASGVTVQAEGRDLGEDWGAGFRAAAVDAALATQRLDAWEDLIQAGSEGGVAPVVARRVLACPDEQLRDDFLRVLFEQQAELDVAAKLRLATGMLEDPAESIRQRGLRELRSNGWPLDSEAFARVVDCMGSDDRNTVSEAIRVVSGTGNPEHYAKVAARLDHPHSSVREAAAAALAALDPERAGADLVAVLADRSSNVRYTACGLAEQLLDPRLVPALIERLRDSSGGVREKAKGALEAIEYFVSQESRWKRLLGEAGLDAPNAAEALIRQARTADAKPIRLAAIQSLGTLAVPETLPFLIQLMQDDDPEIARAAASAVERINARD